MVVTGGKYFQGQIFSTHENKQNFMYRCLKSRLGGNLGHQIVQGRWPQEKKGLAYKLPGDGSCSFGCQKFSSTVG